MHKQAKLIVAVVFAGFASVYVVAGAPSAVAVFAVQVLFTLRRWWWLVPVQAVLAYGSVLVFGSSVGILGFVGGSLLLTPLWPLAPAVVASAALLGPLDPVISMVLISLVVYGLTRMIDRIDEVNAARLSLAVTAAAEERLRIAAELSAGLGRALSTIAESARTGTPDVETARRSLAEARAAAASYRAMSLAPEITTARAMLTAAGVAVDVRVSHAEPLGPAGALLAAVLREAVTDIVRRSTATVCRIETFTEGAAVWLRVSDDGARTAGDENLGDLPEQIEKAGGTLTVGLTGDARMTVEAALPVTRPPVQPARDSALAIALLTAVLVGFSVKALLAAGSLWPVALLAVIVVMQVRSVEGRHPVALSIMGLLTFAPIPLFGQAWLGVAGFLAGPILLAFPWAVALLSVAAIVGVVAVSGVLLALPVPLTVNYAISTVVSGLVVYGLLSLARMARELRESRDGLARAAVVEERLRAARDLHDLLGHTLAAILLKCELARRLDAERARKELQDVLTMTERAMEDLRTVSGRHGELSLTAEAESARALLSTAGVEVELDLGHDALGRDVETTLGVVLREAVTNVLRHSSARRCVIMTSVRDGLVRLSVRNDGVRSAKGRHGSAGIGNLTTRLAALDGRLDVTHEDGWFELTAEAPTLTWAPVPSRPAQSRPS
ncbi:signal transduction histidine kinase [Nonomuraea muscovyensis]|uniref:Signal transduction histidine kinase n=1 Tax=Nonomuraea muscovyensis TaxID=1124761 RepID=A0A7X0C099_9ACTN|nr:histidine kinase [Nonomuraea muscovyensis]MBB6346209.1 signal transduction histidine kinase [Nonomuraea muscovyensis]